MTAIYQELLETHLPVRMTQECVLAMLIKDTVEEIMANVMTVWKGGIGQQLMEHVQVSLQFESISIFYNFYERL